MIESARYVKNDVSLGEIQRIKVWGTSGWFNLHFGAWTANIDFNVPPTAATIKIKLGDLSTLSPFDIQVTEVPLPPLYTPRGFVEKWYDVEFINDLAGVDVATIGATEDILPNTSASGIEVSVIRGHSTRSITHEFHDDATPFEEFTTEVEWRQQDQPKAQGHGLYGSYPFMGKRTLRVSGDLLASDSGDYWQRRLDMISLFDPVPGERHLGKLYLDFTGISEEIETDVSLEGYPELPLEALSPEASKYMISFKSDDPYLYGVERTVPNITAGSTAVLNNQGNATSKHLVAELSGRGYNPQITHLETGKTLGVSGLVLAVDDVLEIDFYNREIHHLKAATGEIIMKQKTDGEWFPLLRGQNNLVYQMRADGPINEIQKISVHDDGFVPIGTNLNGTYTLVFDGQVTSSLSVYADYAAVLQALEALSNIAPGDVTVINTYVEEILGVESGGLQYKSFKRDFQITFGGNYAGDDVPQIFITPTNMTSAEESTIQDGYNPADVSTARMEYKFRNAYLI